MTTRSHTYKTTIGEDHKIQISTELASALGWEVGDELVVALASTGMVQMRNLTTKVHSVVKETTQQIEEQVKRALPKGFSLVQMSPLTAREGYGLQLSRPANSSGVEYWEFLSELTKLKNQYKIELEVQE